MWNFALATKQVLSWSTKMIKTQTEINIIQAKNKYINVSIFYKNKYIFI